MSDYTLSVTCTHAHPWQLFIVEAPSLQSLRGVQQAGLVREGPTWRIQLVGSVHGLREALVHLEHDSELTDAASVHEARRHLAGELQRQVDRGVDIGEQARGWAQKMLL